MWNLLADTVPGTTGFLGPECGDLVLAERLAEENSTLGRHLSTPLRLICTELGRQAIELDTALLASHEVAEVIGLLLQDESPYACFVALSKRFPSNQSVLDFLLETSTDRTGAASWAVQVGIKAKGVSLRPEFAAVLGISLQESAPLP
ncbi:hypothetical protein BHK69_01040 [Bosea vaviloviae]|uniref:Uncharacterized protein n=1 Tax=Bosea vaviloviae TaxID=1526658 RepID=A0A1D7TVX8_9HYPH|nr:hypothetical protein BHK69_01040 [Bosea vaviloviae]